MREIKFRAWWSSEEHKNKKGGEPCMLFVGDGLGTTSPLDCCRYATEGQPVTLMQYTGLKDKNGVEMYEGDIVKITAMSNICNEKGATNYLIVRFFMGNACLCFGDNETGTPIYPLNVTHTLEVIGNIYENPELLEGDL